jgi:hypothetical protein
MTKPNLAAAKDGAKGRAAPEQRCYEAKMGGGVYDS